MYCNTTASIKFNDMYTKWLDCSSGVRQWDVLSTTLFSIYINDLAKETNELGLGVPVGDMKLSILLYADDIVLITENENDLQTMLCPCHISTIWTNLCIAFREIIQNFQTFSDRILSTLW